MGLSTFFPMEESLLFDIAAATVSYQLPKLLFIT